jgi:predicted permease
LANVDVLIEQMEVFAVLMIVGFAAYKIKLINDQNTDNISVLLTRIILPLMVGTSIGGGNRSDIIGMGSFLLCSFLVYGISFLLSFGCAKVMRVKKPLDRVHVAVSAYSNSGFFAAPITIAMFGDIAALAFAAYTIADALCVWTLSPVLLDPNTKGIKINWKKVINPVLVATFIGIILLMLSLPITDNIVWNTLEDVGSTSKYFACMYIGADVARKGIKIVFKYPKVIGAVFTKLIVYPFVAVMVIGTLGLLDSQLLAILTIYCSSPTMVLMALFARQAGNNDEYVASGIVLSSVLSLVTMPFVMWFLSVFIY